MSIRGVDAIAWSTFRGKLGGRPRVGFTSQVSPDSRWIVSVQARNGLLMRPDGQLFVVPATGGQARKMRSNTPLMNSWRSFSRLAERLKEAVAACERQ